MSAPSRLQADAPVPGEKFRLGCGGHASPFHAFCKQALRISFFLVVMAAVSLRADETNRASLKISGFGLLGNLELKKQIRLMQEGKKPPIAYNANQVEDIVLIVLAKVKEDGYLEPKIQATLTLTNGTVKTYQWNKEFDTILPRPLAVKKLALKVQRGVRFYYERLDIEGLNVIPLKQARQFFINPDALFHFKSMRIFTPSLLQRSLDNLQEALNRRGYQDASVTATNVERNSTNGAVQVTVKVHEGLPTFVRSVHVEVFSPGAEQPKSQTTLHTNVPFSRRWEEDLTQSLRTNEYWKGFPDVKTDVTVRDQQTNAARIEADLTAKVETGTNMTLGAVHFEGQKRTRLSVLRHFAHLRPGEPLNPIKTELSREHLARLGIFDSVRMRYDTVGPHTRDVIYDLKEGNVFEVNLLFGYGSYDKLGGGFEVIHHNVLGLAHQVRLRAMQSFKSTIGDFRYTMPEIIGRNIDMFVSGSFLRREEISFDRVEYDAAVGLHRFFKPIKTDATLRYDYQFLNAQSSYFNVLETVGVGNARAAAFVLDLKRDLLDNPLEPRHGYKLFSNVEVASEALGGEVSYQRILLGGAIHFDLGGGRLIHLGAIHGLSFTWGGTSRDLPFNKRFFPGGENSVRGYQYGEAAPRNADGQIVGAETYLQGNAEFEQFLTQTISVVVFLDGVGFAEHRANYPFNEALYSVGGGLRWKTIIGPVRLEYGYNLNPRPFDPSGTIHFSFGFPF